MKNILFCITFGLSLFFVVALTNSSFAQTQRLKFNLIKGADGIVLGTINCIIRDKYGFVWLSDQSNGCIIRYDGAHMTKYGYDPKKPNSLGGNYPECLFEDADGIIWIGFNGMGLDRFDPVKNTFTHYKNDKNDPESLSNDFVSAVRVDHLGNVWVGTDNGLDLLDKKTGKFRHFRNDPTDKKSLSCDKVRALYEDREGTLWVGAGSPFGSFANDKKGGLNKFNRNTGDFTIYINDAANQHSLINNKVRSIFEDSKGNFWVGTAGDGLHLMNRKTGELQRLTYDPDQPDKLSRPPANGFDDHITFITEDISGCIWIGTLHNGVVWYDPATKKVTRLGNLVDKTNIFQENSSWAACATAEGQVWITSQPRSLYKVELFNNFSKTTIPFVSLNAAAGSFYFEEDKNTLWIQSDSGIIRRNLYNNQQKLFKHDPKNTNSLIHKNVTSIVGDKEGNLWISTHWNGVDKLNLTTEKFTHYNHDKNNPNSLVNDSTHTLFFDAQNFLWIGTHNGISKMDIKTGLCKNYVNDITDSLSISVDYINGFAQEKNGTVWVATSQDINRFDNKTGKFHRYPLDAANNYINNITIIYIDASGKIWAAGESGFFYLDEAKDKFINYTNTVFPNGLGVVGGIIEDDRKNLWLSTNDAIIRINEQRDRVKIFNASHGVQPISGMWLENIKAKDGRLFLGSLKGYYSFQPDEMEDNGIALILQFTNFKIGNKDIVTGEDKILKVPIWLTEKINLSYHQNTFSFDFNAMDYKNPGETKYLYLLENYDDDWRDIGAEHKAAFFNLPHGKYILHIKAVNSEGTVAEKMIAITITPPWWKTWWAYLMYAVLIAAAGYGIYKYQKHYIIKRERERTQQKELAQAKEIEKAYNELKTTQAQLIQSEKMASLGELTAGIAHEIQNPLNFVNNFSEVNTELIAEMKAEIDKGDLDEVKAIANDIADNEQKILHHGRRADAIVKGMLAHSRTSAGEKTSTDINALADEYLRLSYYGLTAKDKSFHADMKTDYDHYLPKVNVIPQDIGRVLLNLINNAFYAVNEKAKMEIERYQPLVTVSTAKANAFIEIKVSDNGNGIPDAIKDKIFQPFFTTKPTGKGTGLGLSLAYDIVKAHGGELKVVTTEREGSEFIIILPIEKF